MNAGRHMCKNEKFLIKYYRLSLEDREMGESDSIVNQRSLLEDYVAEHEDIRDMASLELSDDGYTGTNFNRPGIKKFFEYLRGNRVKCLIVKDFSRFTRDYIELGYYAEQIFPFMGVRFIAVNDHYDSAYSDGGYDLELPFKGILNDLYSKDISSKVLAAKRQMIKSGKLCSGSHPYGYQKSGNRQSSHDDPPYVVDEETAWVVRFIFRLALKGASNIEIARSLNEKGILTPAMYKRTKGDFGYGLKENEMSVWDSPKVLKILRDERYMGTLILGRFRSKGTGSGKTEENPEAAWIRMENSIPAIISKEDFEGVQKLRPVRKRGAYRKEHYLLYRKVRCGCCGRYLYVKHSGRGEPCRSFFCKQTHLREDSLCFRGYIKEKELLYVLFYVIRKHMELSDKMERKEKMALKGPERKREERRLKILEEELETKSLAMAQEYAAYRGGDLTREEFLEKKKLLQEELDRKKAEICSLRRDLRKLKRGETKPSGGLGEKEPVPEPEKEMLDKFVNRVWVYDVGRLKIDLRYTPYALESQCFIPLRDTSRHCHTGQDSVYAERFRRG